MAEFICGTVWVLESHHCQNCSWQGITVLYEVIVHLCVRFFFKYLIHYIFINVVE
jgi:hypothetical protein